MAAPISDLIAKNQEFRAHLLSLNFEMTTNQTYKKGNWFVFVEFYPLPHAVRAYNSVTGVDHTLGMFATIEQFRLLVASLHIPADMRRKAMDAVQGERQTNAG